MANIQEFQWFISLSFSYSRISIGTVQSISYKLGTNASQKLSNIQTEILAIEMECLPEPKYRTNGQMAKWPNGIKSKRNRLKSRIKSNESNVISNVESKCMLLILNNFFPPFFFFCVCNTLCHIELSYNLVNKCNNGMIKRCLFQLAKLINSPRLIIS